MKRGKSGKNYQDYKTVTIHRETKQVTTTTRTAIKLVTMPRGSIRRQETIANKGPIYYITSDSGRVKYILAGSGRVISPAKPLLNLNCVHVRSVNVH